MVQDFDEYERLRFFGFETLGHLQLDIFHGYSLKIWNSDHPCEILNSLNGYYLVTSAECEVTLQEQSICIVILTVQMTYIITVTNISSIR